MGEVCECGMLKVLVSTALLIFEIYPTSMPEL